MAAAARFVFWWLARGPVPFSPPAETPDPGSGGSDSSAMQMQWPDGSAMQWPDGSAMEWPGA
ncbi:MAG: hypothetical protein OXH59_01700 [Rhodospirillaceae bacterium]|nr:hypothetical protein [Rhodospirillaceae bacterium]